MFYVRLFLGIQNHRKGRQKVLFTTIQHVGGLLAIFFTAAK